MKIQYKIVHGTSRKFPHVIVMLGRKKYTLIDTSGDEQHIALFSNNPQYYIDAIIAYLATSPFDSSNFYLLNECIERKKIY